MTADARGAWEDAVFVDTCVLVEATDRARAAHASARDVLELHPSLVLSAQVVREYLVVATRPTSTNGLGLSFTAARANVDAFRANARLLSEEKPVLPTFLRLIDAAPCHGKRLHDAHLVATCVVHQVAELVTFNAGDFAGLSDRVGVLGPDELLRRLPVSG